MGSYAPSYVIGVDIGGTNTDTVLMDGNDVLAWDKSTTSSDFAEGVCLSIKKVMEKAKEPLSSVSVVKVGTTVSMKLFEISPFHFLLMSL
jgi:N-methylhydantoinase A/oxoprolinase/acetone carboxylase beta subunit